MTTTITTMMMMTFPDLYWSRRNKPAASSPCLRQPLAHAMVIDPCGGRRFRHGRISCRRYQLLRNRYLRVRQELKRERKRKRKIKHETIELKRALMPLETVGQLPASSAPSLDARATLLCECCFATIKINKYGDIPHEKCKGCHRRVCGNCCFASEEASLWYCRTCVVTMRLLPLWGPTTEGRRDRVLSVSFRVREISTSSWACT